MNLKFNRWFFVANFGLMAVAVAGIAKLGRAAPPVSAAPLISAAPILMGYYPSYRADLPPQAIRFDRFTHLIHVFVRTGATGEVEVAGNLPSKTLTVAAHARGVKVLLGLSGGADGNNFGAMARDGAKRKNYIAAVVKMMVENGYDGLVIDWEFPGASERDVVVALVSEVRAQMRAIRPDALLGMAVPAQKGNSGGFDGPRLKANLDFLHVMTYDYHGPWNHAGHHAALYQSASDVDGKENSFQAPLDFWRDAQGFRPDQLVFGLANYGRGFKVKAWGEKPVSSSRYPEIAFKDLRALIGQGWTRRWDAEVHAPFLESADKTDRISYDDQESVADKARWMREKGLPGFFAWEISQDLVDGDNQLMAAAQKAWTEPAASF